MLQIPIENLLDKTGMSIYKLVVLASRRALEIAEGQPALVVGNHTIKPSAIALEEIAGGKIQYRKIK